LYKSQHFPVIELDHHVFCIDARQVYQRLQPADEFSDWIESAITSYHPQIRNLAEMVLLMGDSVSDSPLVTCE